MNNNVISNGFIASCSDYVFFINFRDNKKIYRLDKDGTKLKLSDNEANSIVAEEGYVYYINSNNTSIHRVSLDGGTEELLYEGCFFGDFTVFDKHLLFVDVEDLLYLNLETKELKSFHFYKKLDNENKTTSGPIYNIFLIENSLFFTDDSNKLYKITSDFMSQSFSTGYQKLLAAENIDMEEMISSAKAAGYNIENINDIEALIKSQGSTAIPYIFDETNVVQNTNAVLRFVTDKNIVFYIKFEFQDYMNYQGMPISHGKLHRCDIEGSSFVKVTDNNITSFYFNDEIIAYINKDNNCRLTIEGPKIIKEIAIDNIVSICGELDKIYLYDNANSIYMVALNTFEVIKLM